MKKILILSIFIFIAGCSLSTNNNIYLNNYFSLKGNQLFSLNKLLGTVDSTNLFFFSKTEYTDQKIKKYLPGVDTNPERKKAIEIDWIEATSHNYITDGNSVFYIDQKIEGADINSFTPLFFIYAIDKNNVYINGKKTNIQKEKFKIIENTIAYSSDGEKIYRGTEEVVNADTKSFSGIKGMSGLNGFAIDKNHIYYMGKIYSGDYQINTTLVEESVYEDLVVGTQDKTN